MGSEARGRCRNRCCFRDNAIRNKERGGGAKRCDLESGITFELVGFRGNPHWSSTAKTTHYRMYTRTITGHLRVPRCWQKCEKCEIVQVIILLLSNSTQSTADQLLLFIFYTHSHVKYVRCPNGSCVSLIRRSSIHRCIISSNGCLSYRGTYDKHPLATMIFGW